jgi:hypothetical protein
LGRRELLRSAAVFIKPASTTPLPYVSTLPPPGLCSPFLSCVPLRRRTSS